MSARIDPVDFLGANPLATADRLEALAADLRRLASGQMPTADQLAHAPALERWGVLHRSCAALVGTVHGHPRLGDDRPVWTSELYAIDKDAKWARTMSRFYVLAPRRESPDE